VVGRRRRAVTLDHAGALPEPRRAAAPLVGDRGPHRGHRRLPARPRPPATGHPLPDRPGLLALERLVLDVAGPDWSNTTVLLALSSGK